MRQKIIIRLNRHNEFNAYWAFLIICAILCSLNFLLIETIFDLALAILLILHVTIPATLYQGFEIIRTK